MADLYSEPVVFEGTDPKECEAFVAAVRRRALEQDKHRNNEWMAVFASSYLGGAALYWYEDLDEGVQNDWSRLRPALLARFGRRDMIPHATLSAPTTSASTPSTTIPTAAAAPPGPGASLGPLVRKGCLKVLNSDGELLGYISKSVDREGFYSAPPVARSDALLVSFVASADGPFEIQIVDTLESLQRVDLLGMGWPGLGGDAWIRFPSYVANCCCLSTVLKLGLAAKQKVWTISGDGELVAKYPRPEGSLQNLECHEFTGGHEICWMVEGNSWRRMGILAAKIVFEQAII